MNLAYVGPLPPHRSGIADYGAVLLPQLHHFFERVVGVVQDPAALSNPSALGLDAVYAPADGQWWWREHAFPLYQMGNHLQFHRYVYAALRRYPGCVVLHDGSLLPFVNALTLDRGDRAGWLRELGFEGGEDGVKLGWHCLRSGQPLPEKDFPLLARVVRSNLGVIVHSEYLRDKVLQAFPEVRVAVVPMVDTTPVGVPRLDQAQARSALGLPDDALVLGAFGYIAPVKRFDAILAALQTLHRVRSNIYLACVGEVVPGYDFEQRVSAAGLGNIVRVTGYVSSLVFQQYLSAIDVGLNLRCPSWGETSSTLIRLWALGKAVIISDVASFAEFPEEIGVKIPCGVDEVPMLVQALRRLIESAELREALGSEARAYTAEHCSPRRVAEQYASFVRSLLRWSDT